MPDSSSSAASASASASGPEEKCSTGQPRAFAASLERAIRVHREGVADRLQQLDVGARVGVGARGAQVDAVLGGVGAHGSCLGRPMQEGLYAPGEAPVPGRRA